MADKGGALAGRNTPLSVCVTCKEPHMLLTDLTANTKNHNHELPSRTNRIKHKLTVHLAMARGTMTSFCRQSEWKRSKITWPVEPTESGRQIGAQ